MWEWVTGVQQFFESLPWWQNLLLGIAIFLVMGLGSIAVVAWFLVQLPEDYFRNGHPPVMAAGHPVMRWIGLILKNLLGVFLILAGIVMLFLPGQGMLTIAIGVMLLSFPGKHHLERKLVMRPSVFTAINRLRGRFGRPPLVINDKPAYPEAQEVLADQ